MRQEAVPDDSEIDGNGVWYIPQRQARAGLQKTSQGAAGPMDVFCRPAWQWGMSFFHVHSTFIQSQKQKILTENPLFIFRRTGLCFPARPRGESRMEMGSEYYGRVYYTRNLFKTLVVLN